MVDSSTYIGCNPSPVEKHVASSGARRSVDTKSPHEDAEEHASFGLGMSSREGGRLVVERDAQREAVAAGGDGEGVGADEWYIAAVLVVRLETELSAQLIFGAEA